MEKWNDILDFEGLYQVSNLGNVKSLKRTYKNSGSYSGYVNRKEITLKQNKNRYGYLVVTLCKDGKRYFKLVHRLVAESFLLKDINYNEVNHKDLDKTNNRIENLEWCNRSQNVNHFYRSKLTTSKHKGVSFQKDRNKWISYVDLNNKRINIGRFETEIQAQKERLNFIKQLKQLNYEELI